MDLSTDKLKKEFWKSLNAVWRREANNNEAKGYPHYHASELTRAKREVDVIHRELTRRGVFMADPKRTGY